MVLANHLGAGVHCREAAQGPRARGTPGHAWFCTKRGCRWLQQHRVVDYMSTKRLSNPVAEGAMRCCKLCAATSSVLAKWQIGQLNPAEKAGSWKLGMRGEE